METMYLVKFDDGTWLTGISPNRRIMTTKNWQEAKFYPVEALSDVQWMIENQKPGTVYAVQVSEPKATQLSTEKKDSTAGGIKPMRL